MTPTYPRPRCVTRFRSLMLTQVTHRLQVAQA